MKRIALLLIALVVSLPAFAQLKDPQNGDIGARFKTEFPSREAAFDYITQKVLLPMRIVPARADRTIGYIVTERVFYQGSYNADFIFMVFETEEGVVIDLKNRSYESNTGITAYPCYSNTYNSRAMSGSPSKSFWIVYSSIMKQIPFIEMEYFKEFHNLGL